MDLFKSFWNWLVYSSEDPEKLSLTIKGLIPFLVLLNVGDPIVLNSTADTFTHIIVIVVTAITGIIGAYGALRKIFNTVSTTV